MFALERLFRLPDENSSGRHILIDYISDNETHILAYFPWLTAELMHTQGSAATLQFLATYSSMRMPLTEFFETVEVDQKFRRIVELNCQDSLYIEVQSSSGFIDCLRRFYIDRAIHDGVPNREIAARCGVSLRRVQRARLNAQRA